MTARYTFGALAAMAVLGLGVGAPAVGAQQPPTVKRTVLQKQPLRAQGQEGVMALVEIAPGGREGRHTHPAETFVYVLEGSLTFNVEGKPAMRLKAGDSTFVAPGTIHEGVNDSAVPVKAVAVFVTDKDKPLTTPAK